MAKEYTVYMQDHEWISDEGEEWYWAMEGKERAVRNSNVQWGAQLIFS